VCVQMGVCVGGAGRAGGGGGKQEGQTGVVGTQRGVSRQQRASEGKSGRATSRTNLWTG
jgi:hypothetical protein